MNFLTTARLYLDHSKHGLSDLYGRDPNEATSFNNTARSVYDTTPGYRVIEAMRNHAQHAGLPIHGANLYQNRQNTPSGDRWEGTFTLAVDVHKLDAERQFKAIAMNDLKAAADNAGIADLRPFIREHLIGLRRIHQHFQSLLVSRLEEAEAVYADLIARYRTIAAHSATDDLAVVERVSKWKTNTSFSLVPQLVERRRLLSSLPLRNHLKS